MKAELNMSLVAIAVLSLEQFENLELASLNNALTGFGKVDRGNHGFAKAREFSFIQEDGLPLDKEELLEALSFEINRRIEQGRFQ